MASGPKRRLAGAIAVATVFGGACAVYGPSLLVGGDAGVDGGVPAEAGDAGDPPCSAARFPDRPATDDGTPSQPEIVLAMRELVLDPDAGAGALRGWDLDRRCTCPGRPSCNPIEAGVVCDDPAGRDNSAGLLFASFSAFAGDAFNTQKLNQKIQSGAFTVLVRLRDYNGGKNDQQVNTAIFLSNGMKGSEDGGTPQAPKWDGTDEWTVDPASLFGGTGPPYVPLPDAVDTSSYVTDGMLVATLNEVNVEFTSGSGLGNLHLDVTGAIVTGHPMQKNGQWTIEDGVLAGRWGSRRFLTAFAPLKDPLGPGWLCGDSGTYGAIKQLVCRNRDITTAPQNDNTGAFCDALSIGFGLVAAPAKMGNLVGRAAPAQPCGPLWDDDCNK